MVVVMVVVAAAVAGVAAVAAVAVVAVGPHTLKKREGFGGRRWWMVVGDGGG